MSFKQQYMNVNKSTDNFYNKGGEGDQTYHTMYRASYNKSKNQDQKIEKENVEQSKQRPLTVDRSAIQRKSQDALAQVTAYHDQKTYQTDNSRRFGQYQGKETGMGVKQALNHTQSTDQITKHKKSNHMKTQSTDKLMTDLSPFQNLQTGYEGTRATRCTDHFVRYPYPKLYSNYQQHYYKKLNKTRIQHHKSAFNLEKEAKIINPHRMDLQTTSGVTYKNFKVPKQGPRPVEMIKEKVPIIQQSSYMANYPNWQNGKKDIFHEKHPQFPYYQLPFNGASNYKQNFTEEQMKERKRQHKLLSTSNRNQEQIFTSSYMPLDFTFETTNAKTYKDFKINYNSVPAQMNRSSQSQTSFAPVQPAIDN